MKTVTNAFTTAQKSPSATVVREVYFKKRRWSASASTYVWSTNWGRLSESEVIQVSPITWNLDNDILNEFKVSNVTISVDNSSNKWRFDNTAGFFKQDGGSPVFGYEPYWTKFQIRVGYTLYDGTTETVTIFTGVATEYTYDSENKTCQILVSGLESLLLNTKAEKIGTVVTEENAGTGDGVVTAFTTANPGVGEITEVSLDGIKQVEGSNYSVSNLNTASSGATVTFTVAPDVGKVIRISYSYWPQSKKFEELVSLLLTAGGISAGSQYVTPVSFSNSVLNTVNYTTQTDWDTGTKSLVETSASPGNVKIGWTDSSLRSSKNWSTSISGWNTATDWTSDGTYLIYTSNGNTNDGIYRSMSNACGQFEFKYTFPDAVASGNNEQFSFFFIADNWDSSFNREYFTNGYWINITPTSSTTASLNITADSVFHYVSIPRDTSEHTFNLTRYPSGRIVISIDGTSKLDFTSSQYTSGGNIGFRGSKSTTLGSNIHYKIRDIVMPVDSIDATWTSPTIDMTAAPTSFETLSVSDYANGSALTYETRTSTDGIAWDAWTAVSAAYLPQSALKRYAQVRFHFVQTTIQNYDPYVQSLGFRWITTSSTVTLPALTGESVYSSIQKIGEFTNYEYGFSPDETFFFRPKTSGSSVMNITQSDYIARIGSLDSGYSRTYGIVRATYGTKTTEITADTSTPSSPVSRLATARYEISPDSNIQIPASADIATGVASNLFKLLSRPRRRLKVSTKMLPQLDLSDVVTVNLVNNTPSIVWYLGDPSIYLGQEGVYFWGEGEQMAYGMNAKIIGARYDTDRHQSEFDLEEVLTT